MGFRFVNREAIDCERMSEKRPPRFRREVRASRGMLMRAILLVGSGDATGAVAGVGAAEVAAARMTVGGSLKGVLCSVRSEEYEYRVAARSTLLVERWRSQSRLGRCLRGGLRSDGDDEEKLEWRGAIEAAVSGAWAWCICIQWRPIEGM